MKKWYLSKTVWAGIVTMVTGIAMYVTGEQVQVNSDDLNAIITGLGLFFTLLRFVTKSKLEL